MRKTPACRGRAAGPGCSQNAFRRGEPQKRLEASRTFQIGCAEGRVSCSARRSRPFPPDSPFRLRESHAGMEMDSSRAHETLSCVGQRGKAQKQIWRHVTIEHHLLIYCIYSLVGNCNGVYTIPCIQMECFNVPKNR